jgi:hypothetical protein
VRVCLVFFHIIRQDMVQELPCILHNILQCVMEELSCILHNYLTVRGAGAAPSFG